jgi:hypothetical protein
LDGLDDQVDQTCRYILQQIPLPSIEQAFAQVRRENTKWIVMMEKEKGDSFGLITRGRDRNWGEMRRECMVNLGWQNDKGLKNGMNDRTTNEGWNDFNGLTLTSLNSQVGLGGNLSNPFFLLSSFNK